MDYIDPTRLRPPMPSGPAPIGAPRMYAGGSPTFNEGAGSMPTGGFMGGAPIGTGAGVADAPPIPMAPTIGADPSLPQGGAISFSNPNAGFSYTQEPIPSSAYSTPNPMLRAESQDLGRGGIGTYNNGQRAPYNPNVPITRTDQEPSWTPEFYDAMLAPALGMAGAGYAGGLGVGTEELGMGFPVAPEAGGGFGVDATTGLTAGGGADAGSFFGDVGVDEFGNPTQSNFEGGPGTPGSSDFYGTPGASGGLPNASTIGSAVNAGRSLLGGSQGTGGIMGGIANDPIMAALLAAGIFERPNNPLMQPTIDAVRAAIQSGQNIQGLQIPGVTPSFQRAIDTANTNVGAWKPALDESAAFTRSGGGPITSEDIQRYMNPYVTQALDPAARKVSESATAMRMADAAKSGARGAFGSERSDQLAKLNQRNELMSLGDLYGQGYAKAFDTALGTAGADKSRALTAGGAFRDIGTTTSGLGGQDVAGLTTAGGIETLPYSETLGRDVAAGQQNTGAAGAAARALPGAAQPSLLTNLTGAAGILDTLGRTGGSQPGNPGIPGLPSIPALPSLPSLPGQIPSLPAPPPTIGGEGSFPTDEFDW